MQLTKHFFKKLHDQMKIIDILPTAPKTRIRLDPIDPQDLCVDLQVVQKWSRNNSQLLHLIFQNGMAAFICNKEFIYNHYQQLSFINKGLTHIDSDTKHFRNLRVLNLSQNHITTINHLPCNLQQLFLDFNHLTHLNHTKAGHTRLRLLSVAYNDLDEEFVDSVRFQFSELICLNVAGNRIGDLRRFVDGVKKMKSLKILTANDNPISLLKIYYQYITENVELRVFDGEKYVKPEPPKKNPPPKVEIKQQPKEEKKDPKKDAKKGAKEPQPPKEQAPKPEPIIQVKKKQLTQEDFTKCTFKLGISNFENFTGNLYDPAIFPADHPLEKTQTAYWIEYSFMGTNEDLQAKKVRFDEATVVEGEPNRLNFAIDLTNAFEINTDNKAKFEKGIFVTVYCEEPLVETTEMGEQKLVKEGDAVVMKRTKIGSVFVDVRDLLVKKDKRFQKLYRLWQTQICSRPYFKNPIPNEQQQISKRKGEFEQKLKKEQEERAKQLQQEQAAKNQKKGGKDQKKVDKKPAKKQGKEVISEKKTVEKSGYPVDGREYCYLNENKLHKARKEILAVKVVIE